MKNKITISILIVLIAIPQVASAAWWNPFSWKIFERIFIPKAEVLQTDTPQELIENDIITTQEESEIGKLKAEIETLKKQSSKESAIQPSIIEQIPSPVHSPTQQTNTTLSKDEIYDDIVNKYTEFQTLVTNEISGIKRNSTLTTEKAYFNYLDDILNRVNSNIRYLITIKNWDPRPTDIEIIYLDKFNKIKTDYDSRAHGYQADFEEQRANVAKQNMEEWKQQEVQKVQDKILVKQEKLRSINQQIADLNAKYAQDLKDLQGTSGITTSGYNSILQSINTKYTIDHNALKAEWQQVYYSD